LQSAGARAPSVDEDAVTLLKALESAKKLEAKSVSIIRVLVSMDPAVVVPGLAKYLEEQQPNAVILQLLRESYIRQRITRFLKDEYTSEQKDQRKRRLANALVKIESDN